MMNKILFIFDWIRLIVELFDLDVENRIQNLNQSFSLTGKIYKEVK